jgi:hypothetical protein
MNESSPPSLTPLTISKVLPIRELSRADISSARSNETPQVLIGKPSGLMKSAAYTSGNLLVMFWIILSKISRFGIAGIISHILAESVFLLEKNVTDDKEKVCCHMFHISE